MTRNVVVTRVIGVPFDLAVEELVSDPEHVLLAGLRTAAARFGRDPTQWRVEWQRPVPLGSIDVRLPLRVTGEGRSCDGSLRVERLAQAPPVVRLSLRARALPEDVARAEARRVLDAALGALVEQLHRALRLRRGRGTVRNADPAIA